MFNRYKTRIMKLGAQLAEQDVEIKELTQKLNWYRESKEELKECLRYNMEKNRKLEKQIAELKPEYTLVYERRVPLTQKLKNKG